MEPSEGSRLLSRRRVDSGDAPASSVSRASSGGMSCACLPTGAAGGGGSRELDQPHLDIVVVPDAEERGGRLLPPEPPSDALPSPPQSSLRESAASLFGSLSKALSRKLSTKDKPGAVCIICLETLTEEDYKSGEAITLQCDCKGEMALRHKACAIKWAQVKGNTICDICNQPITNLPDLDSLPPPDLVEPMTPPEEDIMIEEIEVPPAIDLSFDFLRITWIATIVCVLLVQMDIQRSLWMGAMVGLGYVLFVKFLHWVSGRVRRGRVGRVSSVVVISEEPSPVSPVSPVLST